MRKWSMAGSPNRIIGVDDTPGCVRCRYFPNLAPELDSRVKRTGQYLGRISTVPVDPVNLGTVRINGADWRSTFTDVPDMKVLIMSTGNDLVVLAIPLDLCCACREVCKLERRSLGPQVVYENKAVNTTRGKKIRMVSREVDVGDGAVMGSQCVFNGRFFGVV